MPSIILTGHPSAGKTSFAEVLASRALAHKSSLIKSTVIINEQNARPDKSLRECYSNSTEEKLTRSALKSEFDKFVKDPTKLVILDSMNYIKGFRYELHCISKSAGQKHCVIWALCREDVAKAWNEERCKGEKKDFYYTKEMMDELIARYEPPDQRNRWDRPLYRVDVVSTLDDQLFEGLGLASAGDISDVDGTGHAAAEALNRSVYNMHSLNDAIRDPSQSKVITTSMGTKAGFRRKVGAGFKRAVKKEKGNLVPNSEEPINRVIPIDQVKTETKEKPDFIKPLSEQRQVKKMEDLIDEILDSFLLDVEPLKAGLSTSIQRSAESNVLHNVDSISQDTMNSFFTAQRTLSGGIGTLVVKIGSSGETCSLELKRTLQMAEMKRYRRQYIKWTSSNPPKSTSEEDIAKSFLSYVMNQV